MTGIQEDVVQKWVICPAGATRCPIDVKFGPVGRSTPRGKFHVYRGRNVGIQPQSCQNFEFWPQICSLGATRLQYFYEILSICTCLQVAFKFFVWSLSGDMQPSYNYFPSVVPFCHKFSISPSCETADRNVRGCKNGTDLLFITVPSMVEIMGCTPAVHEKV